MKSAKANAQLLMTESPYEAHSTSDRRQRVGYFQRLRHHRIASLVSVVGLNVAWRPSYHFAVVKITTNTARDEPLPPSRSRGAVYLSRIGLRLYAQEQGVAMDNAAKEDRDLGMLAWGTLFIWCGIWWGILEPGQLLPEGTGAIGIGLIFLGVNVIRLLKGIPINLFSTTAGLLFLTLGGLKLVRLYLHWPPVELSICGIFLIVLGTAVLVRELLRDRKTGFGT